MGNYLASSKTREAKKKLEAIKLEDKNGKELLKNFLDYELKKLANKKDDTYEIMRVASQDPTSNIYKFAALLNNKNNMDLFKSAIELQAKSLGTNKEKGLFNKLIFPIRGGNWLNSKSKIIAFLKAEKGSDVVDWRVKDEDDKQSRRMKNFNIVEKLKSKRLSNVLKVFIALVMWNYVTVVAPEINSKINKKIICKKLPEHLKEFKNKAEQKKLKVVIIGGDESTRKILIDDIKSGVKPTNTIKDLASFMISLLASRINGHLPIKDAYRTKIDNWKIQNCNIDDPNAMRLFEEAELILAIIDSYENEQKVNKMLIPLHDKIPIKDMFVIIRDEEADEELREQINKQKPNYTSESEAKFWAASSLNQCGETHNFCGICWNKKEHEYVVYRLGT